MVTGTKTVDRSDGLIRPSPTSTKSGPLAAAGTANAPRSTSAARGAAEHSHG